MGELLGLIGRLVENVFTCLPSVLIRWKYRPADVSKNFFIQLARPDSLQITLAEAASRVGLSLCAINLSPIWVDLERFDVSISVGNQPLYAGRLFNRQRVPGFSAFPAMGYGHRGWGGPNLYFDISVDSGKATSIANNIKQWQSPYGAQLHIQIYGQCKTGRFERTDISFEIPSGGAGILT